MKVEAVEFKPGETIVSEGDPGYVDGLCTLYHIQTGTAEVWKESAVRGESFQVAVLESDDIIGEMSMLLHEPRSATVRVQGGENKTGVTALRIITKGPEELMEKMRSLVLRMWTQDAKRLRDTTRNSVETKNLAASKNGGPAPRCCE